MRPTQRGASAADKASRGTAGQDVSGLTISLACPGWLRLTWNSKDEALGGTSHGKGGTAMMSRLGFDNRMGRVPATYGFDVGRGGNGYWVNVIPKTDFSVDGRSTSIQLVPLAVGIDSSAWVSGALLVRVHAKSSWTGTIVASVVVENIMLVPEEPDVVFAATTALASADLVAAGVGSLTVAPFTAGNVGAMLRVRISYQTTVAASLNTIAIGVDLVGRPA